MDAGLIANRPHKGDESFFVTSKKPSLHLTAESHPQYDDNKSDTTIVIKDPVWSTEECTPYIAFKALQCTVFEIQRDMQNVIGNLVTIKANEI